MSQNHTALPFKPFVCKAIIEAGDIPLIEPLVFDKGKFEIALKELLNVDNASLIIDEIGVYEDEKIYDILGKDCVSIGLTLLPIEGKVFLLLSKQDELELVMMALNQEKVDLSEPLLKAFRDFFIIKMMQYFESAKAVEDLSIRLNDDEKIPNQLLICLKAMICTHKRNISFIIALSPEFRRNFIKYKHQKKISTFTFTSHIPLTLSIGIGKIHLSLEEWQKINEGDFIIIDTCYDSKDKQGSVSVSYNHFVLFQGLIEKSQIKLIQSTPYTMEHSSMTNEQPKTNEEPKDDSDSSFFLGEDEEFFLEDDELKNVLDRELKENKSPQDLEGEMKASNKPNALNSEENEVEQKIENSSSKEHNIIDALHIPLNIKVEIATLTIPAVDLMNLKAGNELILPKEINEQVNLVVNGATVAKGELIQIGDVLGVRIVSL
jgi:flagellar motor switch protein FliN/FliY